MDDLFEKALEKEGYLYIAGIDEAGRGPLAGPVVAGAVILGSWRDDRIDDSKKLSHKKRELLYDEILNNAVAIGIGIVDNFEIDEINILQATKLAARKAVLNLSVKPSFLLTDALDINNDIPFRSIIKGDTISVSIAAASIIAKVARDRMMMYEYNDEYPLYRFDKHKGYGTKLHRELIAEFGPCLIHRKTFSPVRDFYESRTQSHKAKRN